MTLLERQQLIDIALDATEVHQNEIEEEDEHDECHRHAAHLPDHVLHAATHVSRGHRQIVEREEVVAEAPLDLPVNVVHHLLQTRNVHVDMLHPFDRHPANQRQRPQDHHGHLNEHHHRGQDPRPVPPLCQRDHLPTYEHKNRERSQQSADKRPQFTHNQRPQPQNERDERILPILLFC